MNPKHTEYANIEEELVIVFNELLAELPPNTAVVDVKSVPPSGTVVKLVPHNPAAAAAWAHAENGLGVIDFGFGEYGPTFELPIESANPQADKKELLQEVGEMCRAVIVGNCQHRRGFFGITGSIQVHGRPYRITDLLIIRPKPPLRGTRKYEPYFTTEAPQKPRISQSPR
jgi:hypothetical protein